MARISRAECNRNNSAPPRPPRRGFVPNDKSGQIVFLLPPHDEIIAETVERLACRRAPFYPVDPEVTKCVTQLAPCRKKNGVNVVDKRVVGHFEISG